MSQSPDEVFDQAAAIARQIVDVSAEAMLHTHTDGQRHDDCAECARRAAAELHVHNGEDVTCLQCQVIRDARAAGERTRAAMLEVAKVPLRHAHEIHVHVDDAPPPPFDPGCPECAAVRKWSNMKITAQPRNQAERQPIEQWTVTDPYARSQHAFEDLGALMRFVTSEARPDRPTLIEDPAGHVYIVVREDPAVVLQAVRPLSGMPQPLQPYRGSEMSREAKALARLYYALYHNAEGMRFLLGLDGGRGRNFGEAYSEAGKAVRPERDALRHGGVDQVPTDLAMRLVAQGRREAAEAIRQAARENGVEDVPEGMTAGMMSWQAATLLAGGDALPGEDAARLAESIPTPLQPVSAVEAYRKGRADAAEAVRSQARMFGVVEDNGGVSLSAEMAARLAEGTTGVTNGE